VRRCQYFAVRDEETELISFDMRAAGLARLHLAVNDGRNFSRRAMGWPEGPNVRHEAQTKGCEAGFGLRLDGVVRRHAVRQKLQLQRLAQLAAASTAA
jgi:hypothetical protein